MIHVYREPNTTEQRVHEGLKIVVTRLRQAFAARLKVQRATFPKMALPCASCALRSGTDDWLGFELTIVRFVAALHEGTTFYCHHDLPYEEGVGWKPALTATGQIDHDRMPPCSAWFVMTSLPLFDLAELELPPGFAALCSAIAHEGEYAPPLGDVLPARLPPAAKETPRRLARQEVYKPGTSGHN